MQNFGAADGERKSGGFVNVLLPGQITKMGDHLPPQTLATVALAVDGLVHNLSAIPANLHNMFCILSLYSCLSLYLSLYLNLLFAHLHNVREAGG